MCARDTGGSAVARAAIELYGAPLDTFVAERKRLATALKSAGDRAAAAEVARLPRPPISAWAVNRLYREARDDFDALMAAGERLRRGERAANEAHRDALARLRARAAQVLVAGGHAASETTLRRVSTTLHALSALGSFDPDRPGALTSDRDPPGFEVMEGSAALPTPARPALRVVPAPDAEPRRDRGADAAQAAAERRAAAAAAEARSRAIAKATAEVAAREREARDARASFEAADREVEELRGRLHAAEEARDLAGARAAELDDALEAARTRLEEARGGAEDSR